MPRHHLPLTTVLLLLAFVALRPLPAQQRGMMKVVAPDPQSGTTLTLYENSWALVIGINRYQKVTPLNYAVQDARSVRDVLIQKFGFPSENIVLLTDAQATRDGIRRAFSDLSRKTSKPDRVVVFYAGHGETETLPTGGEMGYLVPVDGDAQDLYYTCLSMEEIKQLAQRVAAKHILFLVDACYGGLAAVQTRSLDRATQGYLRKITAQQARQILTAGGAGEQVVERSDWGHSAFTYELLQGLDNALADLDEDGLITAQELATFMQGRVARRSENRQRPVFRAFTPDEGEFVFVLPRAGSPPPPPPPPVAPPTKTTDIVPAPQGMVYIPGGTFQMGSNDGNPDERPVHTVTLDGFWIDIYEVTDAEFERFVQATRYQAEGDWRKLYKAGRERYPVVDVSWNDAAAYAQWAGKRLPTEAEWEYAARGGLEGKRYPWGDEIRPELANYAVPGNRSYSDENALRYLQPVGSYPPNGYGLYDVVGNVWEWVADWYDEKYYSRSPERNPSGPSSGQSRVWRGGAWDGDAPVTRASVRYASTPVGRVGTLGFRCARSSVSR